MWTNGRIFVLLVLAVGLAAALPPGPVAAQSGSSQDAEAPGQSAASSSEQPSDGMSRLRIEITGVPDKKPVADASVYVKFGQQRVILKDRVIELNLKTNAQGLARTPAVPQGKVLIQVVAPGWRTFGQWYDVSEAEQTIRIELERPARRWF